MNIKKIIRPQIVFGVFLLLQVGVWGQNIPQNVVIDSGPAAFGPEEPSILIIPGKPNQLVAGANINRLYVSSDTGATWENVRIQSSMGVYGDPCLVADNDGRVYFFHLSNPEGIGWASPKLLDRIVCQRSDDYGKTWNDGRGIGENHPKDQDKEWATINPNNQEVYLTWTQFDLYGSDSKQDSTHILFSKSKKGGKKWKTPIRINEVGGDCIDSDETVEGAVPAAGPNNEIYVCWALHDTLYFDRSFDGGKTWMPKDFRIGTIAGGWDMKIPGIQRCNGMPVTKVDLSKGPNRGSVYVNWADQSKGPDDTDIWLIRSDDSGETWTDPIRVNQDTTQTHQFFTWMDIDPITGYIYIVYYDRSAYDDNRTDVVLSYSKDGGETFVAQTISESPFTPNDKVFFGDYNNISAYDGIIRPIWTRLENDTLSILTALITVR